MAGQQTENTLIGKRVAMLREDLGLTQEQLSEKLGIRSRQSLQAFESGKRKLKVEELLALMELSDRPLSYFTDPFLWVGEGKFSFRVEAEGKAQLAEYEKIAGTWAMFWRYLADINGIRPSSRPGIEISPGSSYEDVDAVANTLARWLNVGEVPAASLPDIIEQDFLIPVLYVDAPKGISGATYHDDGLNIIFINRNEVPGRRNFNLGHEFFHALTWNVRPPSRVDGEVSASRASKRWEQLANIFASTLLMPGHLVGKLWSELSHQHIGDTESIGHTAEMIHAAADHFQVTRPAMFWRLVGLHILDSGLATEIIPALERISPMEDQAADRKVQFSRFFLKNLAYAIDNGRISVRKAASIFQLDADGLADAFRFHGLPVPFDI
jgi:XRE family transcriptional regulator, fatty acid utilization regulator